MISNMYGIQICLIILSAGVRLSLCTCSTPWVPFGDSCYLFSKERRSWLNAEKYCRFNESSALATIDSEEKTKFIDPILQDAYNKGRRGYWIGGSDFAFENEWRWIKTGGPIQYFNWGHANNFKQEPNGGGNENCLEVRKFSNQFKWNDEMCDMELFFICERT